MEQKCVINFRSKFHFLLSRKTVKFLYVEGNGSLRYLICGICAWCAALFSLFKRKLCSPSSVMTSVVEWKPHFPRKAELMNRIIEMEKASSWKNGESSHERVWKMFPMICSTEKIGENVIVTVKIAFPSLHSRWCCHSYFPRSLK